MKWPLQHLETLFSQLVCKLVLLNQVVQNPVVIFRHLQDMQLHQWTCTNWKQNLIWWYALYIYSWLIVNNSKLDIPSVRENVTSHSNVPELSTFPKWLSSKMVRSIQEKPISILRKSSFSGLPKNMYVKWVCRYGKYSPLRQVLATQEGWLMRWWRERRNPQHVIH